MSKNIKIVANIAGHGNITLHIEIHDAANKLPTILLTNGTDFAVRPTYSLTGFHAEGDEVYATLDHSEIGENGGG